MRTDSQPPSGGCVLKLHSFVECLPHSRPAAFGRLCVETVSAPSSSLPHWPAAFGRLCVETQGCRTMPHRPSPAAFGRLCVETVMDNNSVAMPPQPPSGGCVLKRFWAMS